MLGLGLFLMDLGFFFLFQGSQNWAANPDYLGETLQSFYNNSFADYFTSKFVSLVPLTFIPGGSLIFFSIFIWWFSRLCGLCNPRGVGGAHEKSKAAEAWGFKKVAILQKNYDHSINAQDYSIDVVPAATLDDYLKECLVEQNLLRLPVRKNRQ